MNVVQRNVRMYADVALQRPGSPPVRKWPISYRSIEILAPLLDGAVIVATGILSGLGYNLYTTGILIDPTGYAGAAAVVTALFVSLMKSQDLYGPTELLDLNRQIRTVAVVWATVFLFLASVVFALKIGANFSRVATISFGATGFAGLLAQRMVLRHLLKAGLSAHKFSGRDVVLITDTEPAVQPILTGMLARHGFRLRNCFVLPAHTYGFQREEETISGIVAYLRGSDIQEVVVSTDLNRWPELARLFSALRILPLPVSFIPVGPTSEVLTRPSHVLGGTACFELHRGPLSMAERALKRSLDILCAGFGLFLFLPLLTITAIAIKLDSPGPILFRQRRCGFNGKPFQILKFRTMSVLEDGETIRQARRFDHRFTRVGAWLRQTSIDELPQLLNVLEGSMSLVGPRPHAVAHDGQFEKLVRNYAFRQHVKPGLTGWAQVNGCRGATPRVADIERRVERDLWYIDHWSLGLDFIILMRTFLELTRSDNAY